MHRQKVAEVEKLTQTVRELEEAVLSGGAAANAVREYQRRVQEMNVMTASFRTSFFPVPLVIRVFVVLQIASYFYDCTGGEKSTGT